MPVAAILAGVFLGLFPGVRATHGATLNVTALGDGGSGSLRQTVADAETGDTIRILVVGSIILTNGEIVLARDLEITGPGARQISMRAQASAGSSG